MAALNKYGLNGSPCFILRVVRIAVSLWISVVAASMVFTDRIWNAGHLMNHTTVSHSSGIGCDLAFMAALFVGLMSLELAADYSCYFSFTEGV